MKRQQLTAILLSAVLSVSICLPPAGITAWAAEGMTEEQTTEQVQENADNVLPGEKDSGEEKDSVEGVTADEEGNGGEEIISEDAAATEEGAAEEETISEDAAAAEEGAAEEETISEDPVFAEEGVAEEETISEDAVSSDEGDEGEDTHNDNLTAWAVGHENEKGNTWQNLSDWEGSENLEIGDSYRIQIEAETVDGTEPTFQWYQNHKLIEGATSPTFDAVIYQSSWNYFTCKVHDDYGNMVEIFCQIYGNGSEDQNYDDNLKAWIVGHEDMKDEGQQAIYEWGEETPYIGDTFTLQAEIEMKDGSTPFVQWYKDSLEAENIIEGANSLTYEAVLSSDSNAYVCCIQDDYGNQVTIECYISAQIMEGNLKAWVVGHEDERDNTWQNLSDWEGADGLRIGDSFTIQVETETQDGSQPSFQWYRNDELIEGAVSSSFEAVMYQQEWNQFLCKIWDTRGNVVEILCQIHVAEGTQLTATPIGIDNPGTATFSDEARWVAFSFTPETDGHYTFYTESDYNTHAYLKTVDGEELGYYDDGGDGENFKFSNYLYAGTEYVLEVAEMNSEDCSCTVYVEEGEFTGGGGDPQIGGNLAAWPVGHEDQKGNSYQNLCDWEGSEGLEIGDSYRIQIMAETLDGTEPTFQWYQNRKLIQGATSATFDAVIYQSSWNYFTCKVRDDYGNMVEIFCQIYGNGSEDQNHDDNLKAWIVGHEEMKDESQQTIDNWGWEETPYVGDTVTLQAQAETKDGSTPLVQWYKGYESEENLIEGANSLTYEAFLDKDWNVYTCCIQDDYGNQVTLECCISAQVLEGNLKAWAAGHEGEKDYPWQDIYDWEDADALHVGSTYNIQILTETQDGSEPTFQWYQEEELIEGATSSDFEAVMYQEGQNWFRCIVTDKYTNQVEINCYFNASVDYRQLAVPITVGTPGTAEFSEEARWVPFTFTPENNGKYVFYTESDYNTQAYLYDGNDQEIGWYYEGGEGNNFRFTARLNAGEEYLLNVAEMNSEDCSCTVHVEEYVPNIVGGMELYGDASVMEDGSVQLTPAEDGKTGSAWLADSYDTENGLKVDFSWYTEGDYFGDGMTMMFSEDTGIGSGGDNLGFVSGATGVEFDGRQDGDSESGYYFRHIAILQGNTDNHTSRRRFDQVGDSQWHEASVLYKPGYMTVYVDGEEIVHAVDINLPDKVYIGASAANSYFYNRQMIKNLSVSAGSSDFPDTDGWENIVPPSYNITFNAEGGYFEEWDDEQGDNVQLASKTITVDEGRHYYMGSYKPSVAPEGKVFSTWTTEGDELVDPDGMYVAEGDIEYFAVWEDGVTITYDAGEDGYYPVNPHWDDDGNEIYDHAQTRTETVQKNSESYFSEYIERPSTDTDKIFMGWSLTEGGSLIVDEYPDGYTLTEDLTVYAVWAEPCRITFDAGQYGFFEEWVWNEETEVEETQPVATRTLTVGKGTRYCMAEATSPNPNDDSKKFIGWSLTSDGDPLFDDYYTITEDTSFFAVWADPCTITFDAGQYGHFELFEFNEETGEEDIFTSATQTLTFGKGGRFSWNDAPAPVQVDDSKMLIGWSLTSDGEPLSDDYYTITEDTTFYVVWADPCVITWDANGGYFTDWIEEEGNYTETQIPSRTDRIGKGVKVVFENVGTPYPPDEESEFLGWALSPKGKPLSDQSYKITEDITFYAIWSNGTSPAVIEITDENVTVASDALVYNGEEQKPAVTVTVDGSTLTEGTDYRVEYSNNINPGNDTAAVKIIGEGDYTGEVTKTFSIGKANQTITASNLSLTFPNGGKITASGNKGALSYTSSNTSIAAVDASGNVTAKGAGKATITIKAAETDYYKEGTKQITVTIAKANQTITASNLSLTFPNKGKITVSGSKGTLSYTSSKTSVATVDASGNVTSKGAGSATITIKAAATSNYNAASKQITVTVAKGAQSITTKAKASSVAVGKTVAVTTTGAKGTVTYKTSDTGIATVNASTGVVTAKKVGTVKITATAAATANYNAASKTVTIKVVPAATTSLKAENMAKGIKVTWAKVTGANGYDIYRNNSKVKTITSGTTVTWTDTAANTNNTKYVYKVVAKASTGASTLSKSLTTYKVTAPTNKSAVNVATRKAVLTWTRNASANGYQVQYSLASNFSSAKAVTITNNSTLTTTVSSLTNGKTYYTRIRAYKTVGSTKYYSNWSAARTVKISK